MHCPATSVMAPLTVMLHQRIATCHRQSWLCDLKVWIATRREGIQCLSFNALNVAAPRIQRFAAFGQRVFGKPGPYVPRVIPISESGMASFRVSPSRCVRSGKLIGGWKCRGKSGPDRTNSRRPPHKGENFRANHTHGTAAFVMRSGHHSY